MKKSILVIIISLILTGAIFFAAQTLFGQSRDTGELQITSQPQAKVYLNNSYIGDTPICRCAGVHGGNVLRVGDYTVQIVPKEGSMSPFFEHVTISKNVLTVVDYTFADNGKSNGSTLQLSPSTSNSQSSITITSFPGDADVSLDDNSIGKTPLVYKNPTDSDHILTIKKAGYDDKELHIRTPQGYNLQAIVYLSVEPNNVGPTTASSSAQTTNIASESADLTPSPKVAQVTILDTPTGYLNVRSQPSLSGETIGQVKPGDALLLIGEQDGWYQVKFDQNKIGWVSSQYASKN